MTIPNHTAMSVVLINKIDRFIRRSVFALTLLLTFHPSSANELVTFAGDPWPPYVTGVWGEEAQGGFAIVIVKEIFRRLEGVDFRMPILPWKRALREVEQGTKDGIVALLKNPERERYMVYTEPLFHSSNRVWYSRKRFPEGFNWDTLEDLAKYKVGTIQGFAYGDEIDPAIESGALPVTRVPTVDHLFKMLSRGRVDIALANDAVGYALARRYAPEVELVPAKKMTGTEVHYIAFSKKSAARELVPRINKILSELKAEGFIDRVLANEEIAEST